MLRKIGVALLLAVGLATVAACANSPDSKPGELRRSQQQLVVAEYAFQSALTAIQVEVRAQRMKGEAAATVQKAVAGAKVALDTARVAIAQQKVDAALLVVAASSAVENLLTLLGKQ